MLQVPMNLVKVKPSNNFVAANGAVSGGSVASELVCYVSKTVISIREKLRELNGLNCKSLN